MVLDKKVELLTLQKQADGNFSWIQEKTLWTSMETTTKTNLFSKIGIGVRTTEFTLRATNGITQHHALRRNGQLYFITAILQESKLLSKIVAANVKPLEWTLYHGETDDGVYADSYEAMKQFTFPAPCVEKYMKYAQEIPMAQTEISYVIVTPKAIKLKVDDILKSSIGAFVVQACHTLDEYKNEYEIYRKGDV